jgi:hypothetical protein
MILANHFLALPYKNLLDGKIKNKIYNTSSETGIINGTANSRNVDSRNRYNVKNIVHSKNRTSDNSENSHMVK